MVGKGGDAGAQGSGGGIPDNANKEEAKEDVVAVKRLHDLRRLHRWEGEGVRHSLRHEHRRRIELKSDEFCGFYPFTDMQAEALGSSSSYRGGACGGGGGTTVVVPIGGGGGTTMVVPVGGGGARGRDRAGLQQPEAVGEGARGYGRAGLQRRGCGLVDGGAREEGSW